jgi:hypothetical protein
MVKTRSWNNPADPNAYGDEIGVATSWQLPGVFAGNPPDALAQVQAKIDSADWGYDHVRGIGPAKLSPPLLTSTYLTKFRKNAAKACLRLGLPQRLSKCCQNQAQRPEAVTATRWLLATA